MQVRAWTVRVAAMLVLAASLTTATIRNDDLITDGVFGRVGIKLGAVE